MDSDLQSQRLKLLLLGHGGVKVSRLENWEWKGWKRDESRGASWEKKKNKIKYTEITYYSQLYFFLPPNVKKYFCPPVACGCSNWAIMIWCGKVNGGTKREINACWKGNLTTPLCDRHVTAHPHLGPKKRASYINKEKS